MSFNLLCFSGTGNSAYVASSLARILEASTPVRLPAGTVSIAQHATIIWVFPVYSWGVPPVVAEAIRTIQFSDTPGQHYMVCTCGDDTGYTDRQFHKLIEARGWLSAGAFSVIMPNTYVTLPGFDVDSDSVRKHKLAEAPARIRTIASLIAAGSTDISMTRGSFPGLKSRIIYPWFIRHLMSPDGFHCSDSCTGCGRCMRRCPMANITLNADRHPVWDKNCAFCLACYHICPEHAIAYRTATARKGQYICPL
ncbi:MAG: EFR1 family ferrodoxin [Muribaculaceae bacterium]|nr:EFR1 family ferrodoxin [Muribaculaceae bacterium]